MVEEPMVRPPALLLTTYLSGLAFRFPKNRIVPVRT